MRLDCNSTCRSLSYIALAVSMALPAVNVRADLVASHSGSADPTTEGWTPSAPSLPSGQTVGPVTSEALPAWSVNDGSSSSSYFYSRALTPIEIADANSIGWTLSITLRVPNTSDTTRQSSPFVTFDDGVREWWLGFERVGLSGDDTLVRAVDNFSFVNETSGPDYTVAGGTATYNTYSLQKAPGSPTAQLFVNGVERVSNYSGAVLPGLPMRVAWGGGSGLDTGTGNFNAVTFNIAAVPEVGSFILVGAAGAIAVAIRRFGRGSGPIASGDRAPTATKND
jgi:hypothetical protein